MTAARVEIIRKGALVVLLGETMLKRFFWFEREEAYSYCEGYNDGLGLGAELHAT